MRSEKQRNFKTNWGRLLREYSSSILLFLFILSCGQTKTSDKNKSGSNSPNDSVKRAQVNKIDHSGKKTISIDSSNAKTIIKKFAENYTPIRKPDTTAIRRLPEPSDTVLAAFKHLEHYDKKAYEKYLTLIFVKLYSAHLECCNQSYELRKQPPSEGIEASRDPVLYKFNKLTNKYDENSRIEFIPSFIGYDWVQSNPYLLDYEKIKKHVRIIEREQKEIKENLEELKEQSE